TQGPAPEQREGAIDVLFFHVQRLPRVVYGVPRTISVSITELGASVSDHTLTADGLRKRYGDVNALDGFDLTVAAGTIHGLLGPNGAGKSTALKALATLIDVDGGAGRGAGVGGAT